MHRIGKGRPTLPFGSCRLRTAPGKHMSTGDDASRAVGQAHERSECSSAGLLVPELRQRPLDPRSLRGQELFCSR